MEAETDNFTTRKMFFYLLLYKIVIEMIYIYGISKLYGYSGLTLNLNYLSYGISIIYLLFIAIIAPKDKTKPSTYLFITVEVFLFVPLISYYWLNNKSYIYASYVLLSLIIISLIVRIKPVPINIKDTTAQIWIKFIFVFYVIFTVYLFIKRGGIDTRAFNFDLIYDLRSENKIQGILGYIMNWCTKAYFPFFFLYFFYKKKYSMLFFVIMFQLLMYLSFGNKAFLFSIGVVVLTTYIMKKNNYLKGITLSIIGLNILSYILKAFNISDVLYRAIPYRMIFIPSQIQYQYFDFFKKGEKVLFADGIIGKILAIDSPYPDPIPLLISKYYLGSEAYANSGMFADAYANGGGILVVIIAIIFGIILYLIDSTTMNVPTYIVVGSSSYIMFVLNDTGLQTTLFTGGLGALMILLLLLNSSYTSHRKKEESIETGNIFRMGLKKS